MDAEHGEPKRRGKKSRKQNEKEILDEYYKDRDPEDKFIKQRKAYENMKHLSPNERAIFDNKFTKPKNRHQEEYVAHLRNKNRKIIVASGPAGTGKTLFATEYGVRNFLLGNCEKLIFTRPSVAVDEELGFLP